MKYLGIDYGEAKIGLAVSDGEIAEPLGTISHISQIGQICQRNEITKIVIGISENKMAEKTKKFGKELENLTGLPVVYQDETLTSQMAVKKMVESGKAKMRRRIDGHAVAAALILQDWLDSFNLDLDKN